VAGSASTFVADSLDGPDSLTWNATTLRYTRWAPGRLQIQFDQAGEHVATVNRLGQTTTFYWSSGRLDSLTVPPSAAHLTWHFTYTSGHLSSVTAPPGPGGARTVTLYQSQSPARVDSIKDLDGTQEHFSYSGTSHLVTSVKDPLGHSTTFSYGTANTLASVTVPTDASHALVTSFLPGELAGLTGGAVVDPATVVSQITAPGTLTTVSLDRFGQPLVIHAPYGETTTITRGDTRWPALATRVTAPNGYTTAAAYDGSGRLVTDTALAPFGGSNAITHYTYENRFDQVTRVAGPTGEVWRATYDTLTGERLAEAVTDTGSLYETTYRYDPTCQMVRAVTAPLTPSDSVVYDPRCNPQTVRSPGGAVTSILRAILGRVIRTTSPLGVVDTTAYDVMDRVLAKRTTGPTQNGVASQTVTVTMAYDALGRDTLVTRTMNPNPANLSALTTRTGFDWASRTVRETAPDGTSSLTHYNAAGDVDSVFTRLGDTTTAYAITMAYDSLHHLRARHVPQYVYALERIGVGHDSLSEVWRYPYPLYHNVTGQTGYTALAEADSFVYATSGTAAGRMTHANNGDAKVTRVYYANGAIQSETDSVRTLAAVGSGGDLTHHIYTERYAYDLAGRLTTLVVPPQLAPKVNLNNLADPYYETAASHVVLDTIRYSYLTGAAGTGALAETDGLLPGETFHYGYTPRGDLDTLTELSIVPDGPTPRLVHDTRGYNADGALLWHRVLRGTPAPDTLRDARFIVDPEGRVLADSDGAHYQAAIQPTSRLFLYSGLGQMVSSGYETRSTDGYTTLTAFEFVTMDPLGNWTHRTNTADAEFQAPYGSGYQTGSGTHAAHYDAVSGRLKGDTLDGSRTDTLRYDAAGNVHALLTVNAGNPTQYDERVSYYSLDGHVVAADARSGGGTTQVGHTAFEEYRYDALGRRVWTRARRWCSDQAGAGNGGDQSWCDASTVRRTVWNGSQELAEIQMPATDSTPSDTVENDTLPVHRRRDALFDTPYYDANRLYGVVLYVSGLTIDAPLGITRVHYADASNDSTGAVAWAEYAPYSILPQWNHDGRTDRAVMGGSAAPGQDNLCADVPTGRCVVMAFDRGVFPFERSGADPGTWQGTLLLDKADATGTYYRRNRSYDPNTARFTQEDPLGLGGGLNVYGFASGDPVDFSDPFGLCPNPDGSPCSPTAQIVDDVNQRMKDAVAGVAEAALKIFAGAMNLVTGLGDLYTAGGLNPNVQGKGDRAIAAVSAATILIPGGEEAGSALRLTDGMSLKTGEALDAATRFLGDGYSEAVAGSGRYVSADGLRQVRMGSTDILGNHGGGPHINFEVLAPNPKKPGTNMIVNNLHIYLIQ
jgi:RHS repeat-associated protein